MSGKGGVPVLRGFKEFILRSDLIMSLIPISAGAFCALLALGLPGVAGAEKPVSVGFGGLSTISGSFTPTVLSKTVPTPIALSISGQVETPDGTHPPALQELILETDKSGAINVDGFPACNPTLQIQPFGNSEALCNRATIGEGTAKFEVELPGSPPMPVSGKLRILNGGSKNGVTTLYVRVRVAMPTPAAIVATVKIEKIHNGFFGSKATISIPKLAGGSGSLTSFSATIKKQLLYKGKRFSPLTLKCPSGIVRGAANAIFGDGTTESTEVFRTCTGKG